MKISDIPRALFEAFGGLKGKIKADGLLPLVLHQGNPVRCSVARIVCPNLGEKLGWMCLLESADESGEIATLEIHTTEEGARARRGDKHHPHMFAAFWHKPADFYSEPELMGVRNDQVKTEGTDMRDVVTLALFGTFSSVASSFLMSIEAEAKK